jgi:excisionase family DNA binding protein|tara:strand:- start:63 stop:299 length:237 start_codon:yes stop_codon:yes gene_type:complete
MIQLNEALIPVMERLDRIERSLEKNQAPKLMTLKDVAEYSSLSQMSVRRAIQKGILKPFKDTGKKLFRKDDVDRWLNK